MPLFICNYTCKQLKRECFGSWHLFLSLQSLLNNWFSQTKEETKSRCLYNRPYNTLSLKHPSVPSIRKEFRHFYIPHVYWFWHANEAGCLNQRHIKLCRHPSHHFHSGKKESQTVGSSPGLLRPQVAFFVLWVKILLLPRYSWACEKIPLSLCHDGRFITMIYKRIICENGSGFNHAPCRKWPAFIGLSQWQAQTSWYFTTVGRCFTANDMHPPERIS